MLAPGVLRRIDIEPCSTAKVVALILALNLGSPRARVGEDERDTLFCGSLEEVALLSCIVLCACEAGEIVEDGRRG